MKFLITCPNMINRIDSYKELLDKKRIEYFCPKLEQSLSEDDLVNIIPYYDGWIAGDDIINERVVKSGKEGKLKAIIKWGIGVDNVDFNICKKYNIPIENTPGMFGEEVSDVAIGYVLCLARKLHLISEKVRKGEWYKPLGESLINKKICLIGFGDIGRCTARKLLSLKMDVNVSDPGFIKKDGVIKCNYNEYMKIDNELNKVKINDLTECIKDTNYIVITCSLNKSTHGLVNKELLYKAKKGVKVINVSRGKVVNEEDLIQLLEEKWIDSVALDVFDEEPIDTKNKLMKFEQNIYGSHNGSNTKEAVDRTSEIAVEKLCTLLNQ